MNDQEKLIHNERTKLWATLLNNLSVASVAGAVLLPAIIGNPYVSAETLASLITGFLVGGGLHLAAGWELGKLK